MSSYFSNSSYFFLILFAMAEGKLSAFPFQLFWTPVKNVFVSVYTEISKRCLRVKQKKMGGEVLCV